MREIELMHARIRLALAWLLALAGEAAATGMVAQTFSATFLSNSDFGSGFRVADHGGDVLLGATCGGPTGEDLVLLFDGVTGALKLVIPDPLAAGCDRFGWSIASDGDEIVVGSPWAEGRGVVYVFDDATGALLRTLRPPASLPDLEGFGESVLVAGSDYFVTAPQSGGPVRQDGVALRLDSETGALLQVYVNPPEGGFDFGRALALDGDRLLVADDAFSRGVVAVFDVASGAHVATLRPTNDFPQSFGVSIAVASGRIAVGASSGPGGTGAGDSAGAVYLYDASTLDLLQVVRAPDVSGLGQANFGASLSVLGGDFLVAAPIAPIGGLGPNGAAYLLDGSAGELRYRFHAAGAGTAVAGAGGRALVAARFVQGNRNAAYLFETCASLGEGAACDDGNGCESGDRCEAGRCRAGTSVVVCEGDVTRCRLPGCEPATGSCDERLAPAGFPCFTPPEECSQNDVCDGAGGCTLDPDPDPDRDHVCSFDDSCPNVANPGQEDADEDARGDVCDATDALLVLHDATVRASLGATPKGKIKIRGELLSRADRTPFDASAGLTVRIEDQGSAFAEVFVWNASECAGGAPARAGCRHRGRPASRIDFRPLARQVDGLVVYRLVLDAKDLPIAELPVGPLAVTITSQPPREVSGFDRSGLVTGCRPRGTRLRCNIGAGLP
jgi:hypothetical protein